MHRYTVHKRLVKSCNYSCNVNDTQYHLLGKRREKKWKKKKRKERKRRKLKRSKHNGRSKLSHSHVYIKFIATYFPVINAMELFNSDL